MGVWILLGWIATSAVPAMLESLRVSHCKANLRKIASALGQYQNDNSNQLPLWLTALQPKYIKVSSSFVCPADRRQDKRIGAQPEWMKLHDTGHEDDLYNEYKTADLDGTTGDPDLDEDTIPCSYFYVLSNYAEPGAERTWREFFFQRQKDLGRPLTEMPIVRCYHHLPVKPRPEFDELGDRVKPKQPYDESYEHPTFNILYNLSFREMRNDWTSE